eukprot:144358-Pleurochrysis_carterae.AAC.1
MGEEGRRVAFDMLRMHQLGQPLPPCRFGSSDNPPLVGYITSTCKELKEQRCHKSNSFNLYVNALLPKMRRPTHISNWRTYAARKVVTCHGSDELDKWRVAQYCSGGARRA